MASLLPDPNEVSALLPFGGHKGYGMSLLNEIFGGLIGGSIPTIRGREIQDGEEKTTTTFYFQIIHPEALSGRNFAKGRNQMENLKAVLDDILGHGNDGAMLPGQIEAKARKASDESGGLQFTPAEIAEFNELAKELGVAALEAS